MPAKLEHERITPGYSATCEGDVPHHRVTFGDGTTLVVPVEPA